MSDDDSISQDFRSDKGWEYTISVDRHYVYVESYTPNGNPGGHVRIDRQAWMNIAAIAAVLNLRAASKNLSTVLELVANASDADS